MNNTSLSVGDRIIDSDQIHLITKIENGLIFYKPLNSDYTSSIPLENLSLACIRPLLTKSEIKSFLENLPNEEPIKTTANSVTNKQFNNNNLLKEVLYLNNHIKTGKLLVYLSLLKKESDLSRSDQAIYDQALSHLAEEISVVNSISIDSAKNKILTALKR